MRNWYLDHFLLHRNAPQGKVYLSLLQCFNALCAEMTVWALQLTIMQMQWNYDFDIKGVHLTKV